MTILIITPRIPYPPFRGDKLKIYNIAKNLSYNNSIKILTFFRNTKQLKDLEKLVKLGIQVEAVKLTLIRSIFNLINTLFLKIPFQVAWFKSGKMKKKIEEEISKKKYDVIYFHLIRSAQYLNVDRGSNNYKSLKVLDFTDAVSLYLSRFADVERNIFKKLVIKFEAKRIKSYEKIAENFNTVFICSVKDKNYLISQGLNANIKMLNNGIDTDYFKPTNVDYRKNRIIFTGNMPYYANYDAAIYFTKEIFPKILKEIPEAEFYIVGQKPPLKIKSLSSKNIFVTGFVPDIKTEYLKSAVNVAPMRFGAGTLNKVLESIALGVPIVATSITVEGLQPELKKYIYIANNSNEFSHLVIEVLKNPGLHKELLKEGQTVIKELLSWEKIVSKFEKDLEVEIKINTENHHH